MKLPGIACFFLLTLLLHVLPGSLKAQSPAEDSLLYKNAVYNLISRYRQASGDQSGLLNGSQYGSYPFAFEAGQPFFNNDRPGTGSIVYDGILYENIPLQFDEIQNVLVAELNARRIQLLNARIEQFNLFNTDYIHIVKDTQNSTVPAEGFYAVLYKGNNSLLKKEEKIIREEVGTGTLLRFIDTHQFYYIKRNETWFSIKNKGSILNIFEDRKKELRQYIRKNKLNYKKDRDNMLVQLTAYYDQLIK